MDMFTQDLRIGVMVFWCFGFSAGEYLGLAVVEKEALSELFDSPSAVVKNVLLSRNPFKEDKQQTMVGRSVHPYSNIHTLSLSLSLCLTLRFSFCSAHSSSSPLVA